MSGLLIIFASRISQLIENLAIVSILKKLLEKSCIGNDRNRRCSRPVDDSRCADCQNTDTARGEESAGKKISGIKRHLAVDSQGAPHAFATTAANATDRH